MEGLSLVNRQRYIQKDRRLRNEYIEDLIVTYGHVHRGQ